ncbi:MAG: helix-turn-helix domain-containing protein, partial [Deltaproteobacteria bacterium]|nr:helix-turn-helix domain-containing protein [Deltaproteobacteria bacterium]
MKDVNAKSFERKLMEELCRYIEARSDQAMTLKKLSNQAHLSPAHLQRRFKAVIGVSPKEYQDYCRLRSFKAKLQGRSSISDAVYGAGFGSTSRIYESIGSRLGMTPKQ